MIYVLLPLVLGLGVVFFLRKVSPKSEMTIFETVVFSYGVGLSLVIFVYFVFTFFYL